MAALVLLSIEYQREELRREIELRKKILREAFERDGRLVCAYCRREDLIPEMPSGRTRQPGNLATIDHVVPVSKGGAKFDRDNCVVSCYLCNQKKADKMENDFDGLPYRGHTCCV